jgi:transposase
MLNFPPSVRIFLATSPVDMRRQIDGLVALASDVLAQDPFSGHVFVFRGRRGNRVKVLVWDRNGFILFYKRLEKGRFRFPEATSPSRELDSTALTLLLEGLDLELAAQAPRWHPRIVDPSPSTTMCESAQAT